MVAQWEAGGCWLRRGVIKLRNPDSSKSLGALNAFSSTMYSLAWSPDGERLASASGSDVQVWALPGSK